MFHRPKQEVNLPGWLWFFLILPLGLVVALLYRQKRIPQLVKRLGTLPFTPARRYTEPDSIPLEIRPEQPTITGGETKNTSEAAAAKVDVAEDLPQDDLEIIEGIGPKIAALLRSAGILSFSQLAGAPIGQLEEILSSARLRRLADPGTWPEQARLAAEGKWDELQRLQTTLKGGRRPKTTGQG